ncbi:MAG: ABC transporter permease subunit [Clostridiales bacterium]|nr:ABC transporter permease subunit [Clostridiales bacterium]
MKKKAHHARWLSLSFRHGLLLLLSALWLLPVIWLLLCSFGIDKGPNIRSFFPEGYTLRHYQQLLGRQDSVSQFPRWFLNSLIIAGFNCVISSVFVLSTAYCMSCMRFPLRKSLMHIAIILNLFPGFLAMIAVYSVMKRLGLTDGNTGLIIIYSATSGLSYLVAKGFFDTIPRSLRESATIEGATEAIIFQKIILPLSRPIIVYTVISAFLAPWTDFIFANIMLPSKISAQKTVALGLYSMVSRVNINEYFARFCAGGVLVSIPISILFVIMQKFYVEGITGGAVKG